MLCTKWQFWCSVRGLLLLLLFLFRFNRFGVCSINFQPTIEIIYILYTKSAFFFLSQHENKMHMHAESNKKTSQQHRALFHVLCLMLEIFKFSTELIFIQVLNGIEGFWLVLSTAQHMQIDR